MLLILWSLPIFYPIFSLFSSSPAPGNTVTGESCVPSSAFGFLTALVLEIESGARDGGRGACDSAAEMDAAGAMILTFFDFGFFPTVLFKKQGQPQDEHGL